MPNLDAYKKAYLQAEIAIKGNLSLLIHGETGVGKSMLVNNIHQKFLPNSPLVSIDCGAICVSLLESELFGFEKGAFTGAEQTKMGKIELANNGILFLDEIGNASLDVQQKLLRVLQEKKISRLGSNKEIPVDFMLITATNKDLLKLIEKGEFKKDFYFRIKQIEIELPSLKNNKEITKHFSQYYLDFYNKKYNTHFEADNNFWNFIFSKNCYVRKV